MSFMLTVDAPTLAGDSLHRLYFLSVFIRNPRLLFCGPKKNSEMSEGAEDRIERRQDIW